MKITLLVVGPTQTRWVKEGIDLYMGRLQHYVQCTVEEIPDLRNTRNLDESRQKTQEGVLILERVQPSDRVILLDENGKEFTSREYSAMIQRHMLSGLRRLVFVVGGPYGFSPEVYARADGRISFSRMTFPHELIRLFFMEQTYRAMTILRGEPYHHD